MVEPSLWLANLGGQRKLRTWVKKLGRKSEVRDFTFVSMSNRCLEDFSAELDCNGPRMFQYKELSMATNNFQREGTLGQGGCGRVYKGVLQDGSSVAIKVIANNSLRGERDFIAELATLGRLRHRYLVLLTGWCLTKKELLLVYEYMGNGSLDKLLFSKQERVLDWGCRTKIARGLAIGLLYLHEGCDNQIVHRDLKASNVMLDSDMNPRLGDFGLARLVEVPSSSDGDSSGSRRWKNLAMFPKLYREKIPNATRAGGTFGYTAPECFHGKGVPTTESDVFSFGLVVLEIVCGRRALDFVRYSDNPVLVDWVRELLLGGRLIEAVDPRLDGNYDREEALRLLQVGLICSHSEPSIRVSMKQVVQICNGSLQVPTLPDFNSVVPYRSVLSDAITDGSRSSLSSSSSFSPSSRVNSNGNGNKWRQSFVELVSAPREYTFTEISIATQNFSEKVGTGGFSNVFKGQLLDGSPVAVKRLHKSQYSLEVFLSELRVVGQIRHRNLVLLKGWCWQGADLILIYELMPHGSVADLLFGSPERVVPWELRFKIISGVAAALQYLHEECSNRVVHRDVKPHNVLLDRDFNARLSDLGLSAIARHDEVQGDFLVGTPGFIDPEYVQTSIVTSFCDVYSFGVLVLLMVTRRRVYERQAPVGHRFLIQSVRRLYNEGRISDAIDGKMDGDMEAITRVLHVGLLCTLNEARERPSMGLVRHILAHEAPLAPLPAHLSLQVLFSSPPPSPPSSSSSSLRLSSDSCPPSPR